jgi:hypothetical protein
MHAREMHLAAKTLLRRGPVALSLIRGMSGKVPGKAFAYHESARMQGFSAPTVWHEVCDNHKCHKSSELFVSLRLCVYI